MADVVDSLDDGAELEKLARRFYPLLLERAFGDAGRQVGIGIAFDLANDAVQLVLDELAQQVRRVAETTRADVQALVGRQAAEGWSVAELAAEIARLGEVASTTRAEVIARTETAAAYSRGSLLAYEQSGVVSHVEWLTAEDELTCPVCAPLNGVRAKLGAPFPGGIYFPPAHPNCRCALSPVVRED